MGQHEYNYSGQDTNLVSLKWSFDIDKNVFVIGILYIY